MLERSMRSLPRTRQTAAKTRPWPNCFDSFASTGARMHYDRYRQRDLQGGPGVVENACRQMVGLRANPPGIHCSVKGANSVLVINCCFKNRKWVEFHDWK